MPDESFSNSGATDASTTMGSAKTQVKQAVEDFRSAAGSKAQELRSSAEAMAGEYKEKASQVLDDAKQRAQDFREDGERYIRDNPTRAVLTAMGIGFVLGLVFRR